MSRARLGERSKIKRTEKRKEECKDPVCLPCRRPRAIDSRASRSLRGRGTRERGPREGIPAGGGGKSSDGCRGRARRAHTREKEREREVGDRGRVRSGSVSDDGGGREEAVSMARATTR